MAVLCIRGEKDIFFSLLLAESHNVENKDMANLTMKNSSMKIKTLPGHKK